MSDPIPLWFVISCIGTMIGVVIVAMAIYDSIRGFMNRWRQNP